MEDRQNIRYFLWLVLSGGAGTHRVANVYRHFGSAKAAYLAKPAAYSEVKGLSIEDRKLFSDKSFEKADALLDLCNTKGIQLLTAEDQCFPERLLSVEPMPLLLFYKGKLPDGLNGFSISIVGTRDPSEYGEYCARLLGEGLAKAGVTVVSGMAKGVDGTAQRAAVAAGGQTVAVLGCSVDYVYPHENKDLYENILENGAVISEYPPVTRPLKQNFPARNRLISGLTLGTVIVETKDYGGSLITARWANEQGKDVFAVPGPITRENSKGTNALIRDGAIPVTCIDDILYEYEELYGIKPVTDSKSSVPELSEDQINELSPEDKILYFLSKELLHISDLAELCGISVDELSSRLLMMEMDRRVKVVSGGYYTITR